MPKLWHTQVAIETVTATDAQTNYPASNMLVPSLRQEWRAADDGAKVVDLVLADIGPVEALYLHDPNFPSAEWSFSDDGLSFGSAAAFDTETDIHGRRRAVITIAEATVHTIRLEIAAGTPTDGLAYWRIPTAYAFEEVVEQLGPEWGYQINQIRAQVSQELSNKLKGVASTGIDFDEIGLAFKPRLGEDLSPLVQRTRQATCVWTTNIPDRPSEIWPVRCIDDRLGFTRENIPQSILQMTLREVVA